MQRIDNASSASSLPSPAAPGTPGYWTNGNPGTGAPATIIDADFLNRIQEELMAILAAASISPSKTTYNQVLTAIQALITANGPSLPTTTITGANHSYVTANDASLIERSNSTTAMVDTLPGTSGALANGNYFFIKNIDVSASLTLQVGSGGTINQGNLTGNASILPGETWCVKSAGSGVYDVGRDISAVLHAAPAKNSHSNLAVKWTSNTGISLTADEIVVKDANGNTRKLSAASFAINTATSGVGGMSSGAIAASTPYYIHAVFNPTTGVKGAIMDISKTAPTLPSGFTMWAWLSWDATDPSSHLLGFQQKDNEWQSIVGLNQAAGFVLASGTAGSVSAPTYASASLSGVVPTADVSVIHMFIGITNVGTPGIIMIAPNSSYGASNSTTNPPTSVFQNSSQAGVNPVDIVLQDGVTAVQYASSSTGGFIGVIGFRLNL